MLEIYIDADGCAVKDEVYRVAKRHDLLVRVVSNKSLRIPDGSGRIDAQVVGNGFNESDDWIADHIGPCDLVVTTDIPLAARCIEKGARALSPKGTEFKEEKIGGALASRALNDHLRSMGISAGGPSAMAAKDRSLFLSKLDEILHALRRSSRRF